LRILWQFVLPNPYDEPASADLRPDLRLLSKLLGEQPQVAGESLFENTLEL
jgi:hypothetical protein